MNDSSPSQNRSQIPERKRPVLLEEYVRNSLLVATISQGIGYAGSGANPRPLPKESLHDLKERNQAVIRRERVPDALFFGFQSAKLKSEAPDIIPLRNIDFWHLARTGDTVLLSDRITHHYTTIASVDRSQGKVWIEDPWPDMIFLLEGMNKAGVAAEIAGSDSHKQVVITQEEFLRVIIGLITLDSPDLIEHCFTINPAMRLDARTVLAMGCALLDFGNDSYVSRAVPYLRSAVELAERQDDMILRCRAAQRLIMALQLMYFELLPNGDEDKLQYLREEVQQLVNVYPEGEIASLASAKDFYRLGNSAGRANQFDAATHLYSGAIAKDSQHEDAHTYRALARSRLGDVTGAVEDATEALRLNEAEYSRVLASLDAAENQSALRRAEVLDALSHVIAKRVQTLQIRGRAYGTLGQMDNAVTDAKEVLRLQSGGS